MKLFLSLLFFLSLSSTSLSCNLLTQAFNSVSNFQLSNNYINISCNQIQELNLSSKNISGTISWTFLKNMPSLSSIDLSNNFLQGSIPGTFFSSSTLVKLNLANNHLGGALRFEPNSITYLNLSGNRFTYAFDVSGLSKLRSLDLSRNNLSLIPTGLDKLQELSYLDLSCNLMSGIFPTDFWPIINHLHVLNLSYNNFSGSVNSSTIKKFGISAFIKAGTSLPQNHNHKPKSNTHARKKHKALLVIGTVAVSAAIVLVLSVLFILKKKKKKKGWKEEEKGVKAAEEVASWVAEAKWGAPVVMFEKPLMQLSFSDLAVATSGFSKEWQLGEGTGKSGAVYRAVLPGEMNVVLRVVEKEILEGFREIAKLRHPNLLPLLGYCNSGKSKLLLYEYMEKGDLHQWLHELPTSHPNSEDFTYDAYELNQNTEQRTVTTNRDWPTRHKVALGIARGLAFLHQGWAGSNQPIIHGHLVPSNILLDENLEPRIADFATGGGEETMESNVYGYGVLVMELVTGRRKWSADEVEKVRKLVRDGKGLKEVDFTMIDGSDDKWEKEMVDCLRVGYLCTAQSPEKRPTMQQVVGLIKDIRPIPDASASSSSLQ